MVKATRRIQFRPLRASHSREATVLLRYNRIYLVKLNPNDEELNSDDVSAGLFLPVIRPKRHGGRACTGANVMGIVSHLSKHFPPSRFHITIAVWDDSFGSFNQLKDALTDAKFDYRTISCSDETEIYFGGSSRSLVQ